MGINAGCQSGAGGAPPPAGLQTGAELTGTSLIFLPFHIVFWHFCTCEISPVCTLKLFELFLELFWDFFGYFFVPCVSEAFFCAVEHYFTFTSLVK